MMDQPNNTGDVCRPLEPADPVSRTTDGKRLKYIGQACQYCQRRKVKCSGEHICLNCRLRGQNCIYMPQERRGRKQGTKMKTSCASHRRKDKAREPIEATNIARPSNSPPCNDITFLFRDRPFPRAESNDGSPLDLDAETDAYDVYEVHLKSVFLSSQLASLDELVHPNRQVETSPACRRSSLPHRVFSVELPRPARLHLLLDVYFRDLDSFFPFIEHEETQPRIQSTLRRLGYADNQYIIDVGLGDYSIIALLCNMLAVGECFCASGSRSDEIRPGWSLFSWGRKLIQYCSSLKRIDLHLIQYHALSSEYLMQSELLRDASQAISSAAHLAMRARLNKERDWGPLPEQQIRSRKKLWWTIYFLDRKISQRTGSPYVIHDIEVAVCDFSLASGLPYEAAPTDHYMQVLVSLGQLWSLIWDTFFAAAASPSIESSEVEVMDTRILFVQRELASELAWETDLLDEVYLAQQEPEPHIRRRLAIFIRLNLLRLTIRQNPIQKRQETKCHFLCASLASETVDAIAAFTETCPSIVPCGFFFSTALLECIYHLILAIRSTPTEAERAARTRSFQLAYQLLDRFSQELDTAKRAIRALNSVVSLGSGSDSLPIIETPNDSPQPNTEQEQDRTIYQTFHATETIDFFDPASWQIDDIPMDIVALVSSLGNQGADDGIANDLSGGLCLWNPPYSADPESPFRHSLHNSSPIICPTSSKPDSNS